MKVRFLKASGEDRRLLLAHITRKKLNGFAGVEHSNCPSNISSLVNLFEDEIGVASVYSVSMLPNSSLIAISEIRF